MISEKTSRKRVHDELRVMAKRMRGQRRDASGCVWDPLSLKRSLVMGPAPKLNKTSWLTKRTNASTRPIKSKSSKCKCKCKAKERKAKERREKREEGYVENSLKNGA